jgi:hypothetical protein
MKLLGSELLGSEYRDPVCRPASLLRLSLFKPLQFTRLRYQPLGADLGGPTLGVDQL